MKNRKIIFWTLLVFSVAYFCITFLIHGSGYNEQINALRDIATFFFGIFVAFSIYNGQDKLSKIKESLRSDDSNLISIYKLSSVFGNEVQDKTRDLIDNYLISQIDYKLVDYNQSLPAFDEMEDYVIELDPRSEKQVIAYKNMLSRVDDSNRNRKLVETLVGQKITSTLPRLI